MLWTLILGLFLKNKLNAMAYGYYPEYTSGTASSDPYTRVFYSSSPNHFGSSYSQNVEQVVNAASSSVPYTLGQADHDSSSLKLSTYSNQLDEYQPYQPADVYPSLPTLEEQNYQPLSYDSSPQTSLSAIPTQATYREHESPKIEVSPTSAEAHPLPTYHPAPETSFHINSEPVQIGQHIQITKHVPVPVIKQIHVPVAKPVRVEVPHPIFVPVPKPYQVKVPVVQPIAVPVVKEISVPVEKIVPYPVEKKVPFTVEKHVPYKVEKHVTVHVPQIYPVRVPIIKTIIHRVKTFGRLNVHGYGWNPHF